LHRIRVFFHLAKVPITHHPRQPACGRHPFLRSARIQSQGQSPPERAHVRERDRVERMTRQVKINRTLATRYDNRA
jgi:hypothetical protein